jgi:hypothetical protein
MPDSQFRAISDRLYELEHRMFALEMAAYEREYRGYLARIERLERLLNVEGAEPPKKLE